MLEHSVLLIYASEEDWVEHHEPLDDISLSADSVVKVIQEGGEVSCFIPWFRLSGQSGEGGVKSCFFFLYYVNVGCFGLAWPDVRLQPYAKYWMCQMCPAQ